MEALCRFQTNPQGRIKAVGSLDWHATPVEGTPLAATLLAAGTTNPGHIREGGDQLGGRILLQREAGVKPRRKQALLNCSMPCARMGLEDPE